MSDRNALIVSAVKNQLSSFLFYYPAHDSQRQTFGMLERVLFFSGCIEACLGCGISNKAMFCLGGKQGVLVNDDFFAIIE